MKKGIRHQGAMRWRPGTPLKEAGSDRVAQSQMFRQGRDFRTHLSHHSLSPNFTHKGMEAQGTNGIAKGRSVCPG